MARSCEIEEVAEKVLGEPVDVHSDEFIVQYELFRETSIHTGAAVDRMWTAIYYYVPTNEIRFELLEALLTEPGWRTKGTEYWKARVIRWWRDNHKAYGWEGPGPAGYDDDDPNNPDPPKKNNA